MSPWRARAFHLSRDRMFLARTVAVILTVSALVATLLHVSRQSESHEGAEAAHGEANFEVSLREGAKRLESVDAHSPGLLLEWIRETAAHWLKHDPEKRTGFDAAALRLGKVELQPLIARHTTSTTQADAATAYVRFRFLPEGDARTSALVTLQKAAQNAPPAFVNEMLGDALAMSGRSEEALQAYLREVGNPDAKHSRKRAVALANRARDVEALKMLCDDPRVVAEMNPWELWEAAKITGSRWLLLRALWQMEWLSWLQAAALFLDLLAAGIWYVILIHTASRERWRWLRYVPAIFAGMASTWLVLWWQGTLNYRTDPDALPSVTHQMLEWIMHVGLPEEAAKLILFAFFLPVLLHHRSDVKAALTAGCVGLGFALDENLQYFRDHGPQVAILRLLTANFLHIGWTGILGWHLYDLFRSRFHRATEFLTAFCLVAAAHGFYDFSSGPSAHEWGFDVASMIILALVARHYLHLLHQAEHGRPGGHSISRTSVFVLGTAVLCGILMVVMVWELEDLKSITMVLKEMLGVALMGLIYVREWKEV